MKRDLSRVHIGSLSQCMALPAVNAPRSVWPPEAYMAKSFLTLHRQDLCERQEETADSVET